MELCHALSPADDRGVRVFCTRPVGHWPHEHIAAVGPVEPGATILRRWPVVPQMDERITTVAGGPCVKTQIAEDCCYVRFGPRPAAGVTSDMIGQTVRGERLIADFDAEGRIIGLELTGGPPKPCQTASAAGEPACHDQ